jgi:leucyl aminopeptidase
MNTKLLLQAPESVDCDVLVVLGFEKTGSENPLTLSATIRNLAAGGWMDEVYANGEFSGKQFEAVLLHRPGGMKAHRLALVGGGKRDSFTAAELRRCLAFSVRHFKNCAESIGFVLDASLASAEWVAAAVEGTILGNFEQDVHKTQGRKEGKTSTFLLVVPGGQPAALMPAAERGRVLAESQNFARLLSNEPSNLLPPRELVNRARNMAQEAGLSCDVLDEGQMRQLGMGSLLGVAQGSVEPPFLLVLRYAPAEPVSGVHLGLVGKGVTFDSGGISIKPADGMEKMKHDMSGASTMIGAMRALAQLKPRIPVTAFCPLVENMVSGKAIRPGDILTSMAGKTIEVLNTDAEGRLILVDAITYAKRQGCTHLIDAATLTGAIGVALGTVNTGVFTNDDPFLGRLMQAAKLEGEKLWPMPVDEEYREQLKSSYADIANIGGRAGGACTAAMFLKEWVEETPWIHLDIASTAYLDEQKPYAAKGATGSTLRTLVRIASDWA